jgi:hypothetical protein
LLLLVEQIVTLLLLPLLKQAQQLQSAAHLPYHARTHATLGTFPTNRCPTNRCPTNRCPTSRSLLDTRLLAVVGSCRFETLEHMRRPFEQEDQQGDVLRISFAIFAVVSTAAAATAAAATALAARPKLRQRFGVGNLGHI